MQHAGGSVGDDPEAKLRDSSISELKDLLERAKSGDAGQKQLADAAARVICERSSLDRALKNQALEREILGECARDLPQIEAFTQLHRQRP